MKYAGGVQMTSPPTAMQAHGNEEGESEGEHPPCPGQKPPFLDC